MTTNPAPGFVKHPGYSITFEPVAEPVRVSLAGRTVAESTRAVYLKESNHDPVLYLPLADVRAEALHDSDRTSYCPFKGHARYWTVHAGGAVAEDALWGYAEPYDEVANIKQLVAFYPDKVEVAVGG